MSELTDRLRNEFASRTLALAAADRIDQLEALLDEATDDHAHTLGEIQSRKWETRRAMEERDAAEARAERWEHLADGLAAAIQEAAEFPGNAQRRDVITATALAAYRTEKEGNK